MGDEREPRARRPSATRATRDASGAKRAKGSGHRGLARGTAVDRYIVLEHLATGGMGSVYVAYDPDLNRQLALKIVRAEGSGDAGLRARLLREAQGLARLAHPNVVAIYDVGSFGDDVFVAMELVAGKTLRKWLRSPRSPRDIVAVMLGAGAGLAAAHDAGLVHRDFKPDNILIGDDGRVRVLDFGLVRTAHSDDDTPTPTPLDFDGSHVATDADTDDDADDDVGAAPAPDTDDDDPRNATPLTVVEPRARNIGHPVAATDGPLGSDAPATSDSLTTTDRLVAPLTRVGAIVGTPAYMAPEQHLGAPVDAHSDQFSFCVTLYEALYGGKPFAGSTPAELARNICRGDVLDPSASPRVPARVKRAIWRGLSVAPARRFASMDALLTELRRATRRSTGRGLALAGLAAVATIAGLALARAPAPAADACPAAAALADSVWDDEARARLERSFVASGRVNADAAFTRVANLLDDYAADWVDMRVDACEATRVRGEQSAELLDLRTQCLNDRLDSARVLIAELSRSPDSSVVERATTAALSLPRLDRCADATALRAAVPPPEDPQARQQVEQLRARLRVARTLERLGKYEDGLERATAILVEAKKTEFAPVIAESLVQVGDLQRRSGDYAEARTTLLEAARMAARARDAALAAKAWNRLMWAVTVGQREYQQSLVYADMAAASVEWAGGAPALRADYHEIVGVTHMHLRDLDAAAVHLERALALREDALGPGAPDVAGVLTNLGIVRKRAGDYEGARRAYERAIEINENTDPDHPDVAATLINLGSMIREHEGDQQTARAYFRRAGDKWAASMAPDHPLLAYVPLNVGYTYMAEGRFDHATEQFQRARSIRAAAHGPNHPSVLVVDQQLGAALRGAGRFDEALAAQERALAFYADRDAAAAAELHLDIGKTLREAGRVRESASHTDAALGLLENVDAPSEVASLRFAAARALLAEGRRARAIAAARTSRSLATDDADATRRIDEWLAGVE